jgi:hypothetical protein
MTDYNKYYILDEEKLDKVRHALDISLAISGSQNKPQTKKENI